MYPRLGHSSPGFSCPRLGPPTFVFLCILAPRTFQPRLLLSSAQTSDLRLFMYPRLGRSALGFGGDLLVLFKLSINPTVPCPNSLSRYSTLPNPTPCSPLHVPSNSIARCTISCTASRTTANSSSVLNRAREWTFPSPTCLSYQLSFSCPSSIRRCLDDGSDTACREWFNLP